MAEERVLRLRCPRDVAKPDATGGHLRVDIGQPGPLGAMPRVIKAASRCACGQKMILLRGDAKDPWVREPRVP